MSELHTPNNHSVVQGPHIMTAKDLCLWYGENKALKPSRKATAREPSALAPVNGELSTPLFFRDVWTVLLPVVSFP